MAGGQSFAAIDSTVGAAAPKTAIALLAASNARCKVRGIIIGNTAATAAQGVRWVVNRTSTAGTASTITAANTQLDPDSTAPRSTATSTFTAEPTSGVTVSDFGFDIVGTYILWFPPGTEPYFVNAGRLALQKIIGADTSLWAGTLYWEE